MNDIEDLIQDFAKKNLNVTQDHIAFDTESGGYHETSVEFRENMATFEINENEEYIPIFITNKINHEEELWEYKADLKKFTPADHGIPAHAEYLFNLL